MLRRKSYFRIYNWNILHLKKVAFQKMEKLWIGLLFKINFQGLQCRKVIFTPNGVFGLKEGAFLIAYQDFISDSSNLGLPRTINQSMQSFVLFLSVTYRIIPLRDQNVDDVGCDLF